MQNLEQVNVNVEALASMFAELNRITSGTTITKAQEARASALQARISAIKGGLSAQELAAASTAALRKEIGLSEYAVRNLPRMQTRAVQEWAEFIKGEANELRTDDQSSAQWGNVTGQTYSGTSGTQGGVLVPASYDRRVFASLGTFDEVVMDAYSNVWTSDKLSAGVTPAWDDTSEQGSPAALAFNRSTNPGEAYQTSVVPTKATSVQWGECPVFKTGRLLCALEWSQDTFEPTIQLLEQVIAQRHALAFGTYAVNSITSNLPSSIQKITSNASTLVIEDFINTAAALPRCYRKNAIWLMNDVSVMFLMSLLETSSRPLIEGLDKFLGRPIATCDTLNVGGTSGNAGHSAVAILADPKYLLQRRVPSSTYVRKYVQSASGIEYGQSQIQGFAALDFAPINFDSAFPPVAYLSQHS